MSDERAEFEQRLRAGCEERDYDWVAIEAIRHFGPEILGFLKALLRDESAAGDAFASFCEDLWRGFEGFEWRCAARVWAYSLARYAADRYSQQPHHEPGVTLSHAVSASELIEQLRAETLESLRTETKSRVRLLREQLSLEDQTVIILRVDKQLSWRELAEVMAYQGEPLAEAELDEQVARLRERFQRAKQQLRELAVEEGLIGNQQADNAV